MKARLLVIVCAVAFFGATSGCFHLQHTVGKGAQGNVQVEEREWFALWGLIPLKVVDGGQLADGATDYTVESEMTIVDIIITMFTGVVSLWTTSVTVTK